MKELIEEIKGLKHIVCKCVAMEEYNKAIDDVLKAIESHQQELDNPDCDGWWYFKEKEGHRNVSFESGFYKVDFHKEKNIDNPIKVGIAYWYKPKDFTGKWIKATIPEFKGLKPKKENEAESQDNSRSEINQARASIGVLWLTRRQYRKKPPTCLDYVQALALPPKHIIKAYNELVSEGKIEGELFNE